LASRPLRLDDPFAPVAAQGMAQGVVGAVGFDAGGGVARVDDEPGVTHDPIVVVDGVIGSDEDAQRVAQVVAESSGIRRVV